MARNPETRSTFDHKCEKCGSQFTLTYQAERGRKKKGLPMLCVACMKQYVSDQARERVNKRLENMTPEEYQKFLDQSNWHKDLTPEQKEAHAQRTRDQLAARTPEEWTEVNEKNSEGLQRYWATQSEEERKRRMDEIRVKLEEKRSHYTPEDWKRIYEKRFENMTPEQKAEYDRQQSEQMKAYNDSLSMEEKRRRAQRMQDWHASLDDQSKKEFYERTHEWTKAPGVKEEISAQKKEYWDNLTDSEKAKYAERAAIWYASLSPEELEAYNKKKFAAVGKNNFHLRFEQTFNHSHLMNEFYFVPEFLTHHTRSHSWDYAIFDKSDHLRMVVDLDGSYYHADGNDYNGYHSQEEYDESRTLSIPPDATYHHYFILEDKFLQSFQGMIERLMENYDEYVDQMFKECRSLVEFPFPHYTDSEMIQAWYKLKALDPFDGIHNVSINTRIGDRIIMNFHPEIWHARNDGCLSPFEAWQDDELLKKAIRNRIIFQNKLNPNKILQGFNISKIAPKVSVFSAGRAKIIISKYLSEFDEIFDPFSGFSGRFLGAVSMDKTYIGGDIGELQVSRSNEIKQFLLSHDLLSEKSKLSQILVRDATKCTGSFECLFTCPPYGLKEQWYGVNPDPRSCDDWIDLCLKNFQCRRYVFVVDRTERYSEYITEEIKNKSHISQASEYLIVIEKR